MAFLIPWLPLIASALGAGAGLYGQNKARQSAHDLQKTQQPFLDLQKQNMEFTQPMGQSLLQNYMQGQGAFGNRLQGLMSGNPSLTNQYLAPVTNAITHQYQGATQAARSQYPRSGQSAAQASQLPYELQGKLANTRYQAMGDATNMYGGFLQNQANTGLGLLGQSSGLTNNMLNYGLNAQGQMFGQGAAIGQGISSLVGPLMQYIMTNRQAPQTQPLSPSTPSTYSGPGFTGQGSPSGAFPSYSISGTLSGANTQSNNSYSGYQTNPYHP